MVSLQLPHPPVEGVQKHCSSVEASSAAQKKVFSCETATVALGEDPDALGLKILQEELEGGQVARHAESSGELVGYLCQVRRASTQSHQQDRWPFTKGKILRDKFAADL